MGAGFSGTSSLGQRRGCAIFVVEASVKPSSVRSDILVFIQARIMSHLRCFDSNLRGLHIYRAYGAQEYSSRRNRGDVGTRGSEMAR